MKNRKTFHSLCNKVSGDIKAILPLIWVMINTNRAERVVFSLLRSLPLYDGGGKKNQRRPTII